MSAITTHVLDTSRGRPAVGFKVELHKKSGEDWKSIGAGVTDGNGRCNALLGDEQIGGGNVPPAFQRGRLLPGTAHRKHFIRKFQSFLKCATRRRITTCRC